MRDYPILPPEMEPPRVGWAWTRRRGWFHYDDRFVVTHNSHPATTWTVNAYEDAR